MLNVTVTEEMWVQGRSIDSDSQASHFCVVLMKTHRNDWFTSLAAVLRHRETRRRGKLPQTLATSLSKPNKNIGVDFSWTDCTPALTDV